MQGLAEPVLALIAAIRHRSIPGKDADFCPGHDLLMRPCKGLKHRKAPAQRIHEAIPGLRVTMIHIKPDHIHIFIPRIAAEIIRLAIHRTAWRIGIKEIVDALRIPEILDGVTVQVLILGR